MGLRVESGYAAAKAGDALIGPQVTVRLLRRLTDRRPPPEHGLTTRTARSSRPGRHPIACAITGRGATG